MEERAELEALEPPGVEPELAADLIAMSQIQRACELVYASFASSAFASASTVERNVRSSDAKLPAFVIASRACDAIPASSSSSRPPDVRLHRDR